MSASSAPPLPDYPARSDDERLLAGLAHLSVFLAPILVPLVIYLLQRDKGPYAAFQSLQALLYHLAGFVAYVIGFACFACGYLALVPVMAVGFGTRVGNEAGTLLSTFVFGILMAIIGLLVIVVVLVYVILAIAGGIQSFQGRPFRYPLIGRLADRYMPTTP